MIIKSLTLKPFAGITDQKVEFAPGLNVIVGPNEAGKSTLLNALKSVLFTEVDLTKSKYEKLIRDYMPAQGGNTIRVYLHFQVDGREYWLEKTWRARGKGGSCLFRLDDKGEYTGDSEVSKLIMQYLPAQEGTIQNILLTWQSVLDRTKDIFDSEGREVRADLGNILRSSIMETDGISIDKLQEKLDKEYEAYFQHWDIEREEPENGRGINNPYKKEKGKILEAYYEKENIKRSYDEVNWIEKEIDEINQIIKEKEERLNKIQEELKKYETIRSQIFERQQIDNDITKVTSETEDMIKMNDEWTIQENWLSEIANLDIKKLEVKIEKLEQEREDVRKYLENKELRKRFEKIKGLFERLREANDKLFQIAPITNEDMISLQKKKQEIGIGKIENIIMASKLRLSLFSRIPLDFITRDASGQEEDLSIEKDNRFEKTFQGKLCLEHQDWSLEVQAGEGEIDRFISQKEEKTKEFEDDLKRLGVDSVEQAQSVNMEYEKHKSEVRFAERAFQEELGNDDYKELEKVVKNFGEEKQVHSLGLEEMSTKIANTLRDLREIETKKEEIVNKIKQWKEKYRTKKELMLKVGKNQFQLQELEEKLKNLPKLPDGFEDYKSFFDYLDTINKDREEYREDIYNLREKKSEKENRKQDLSSEELGVIVNETEYYFQRVYLEGKAIAFIRSKTNELLETIGKDTYGDFQDRFKNYFLKMSGNSFSGIEMEDDYPKRLIKPNGSALSYDLLSFGTKDTFSLALRLTMAEYFLKGKEGFLVIDDPLVDMDLTRQALAAEQINEFAKTKQVIFLTCHTHTAELLKGNYIS